MKPRLFSFLVGFFVTVFLAGLVGCGGGQVKEEVEPPMTDAQRVKQIEPEARPLYTQGERYFNLKNFDAATRSYNQIKAKFPRTQAAYFASYRLGIIYYYKENFAQASKEFEQFVNHVPQSDLAFDATYNWAACEFQLGRPDTALQLLKKFTPAEVQEQGPRRTETVLQLMARCAVALGNHPALVSIYASQMQIPIDDRVRQSLESRVRDELEKISDKNTLASLQNEITEPTVRTQIGQRLAILGATPEVIAVSNGGSPAAVDVPNPIGIDDKNEIRKTELPSGGTPGQLLSVGVVLPLTGKWATYGKRALDGILLGSRVFANGSGSMDFRVHVEDSASNPLVAERAIESLVRKKGVMAVLGPLNWKEAVATADRAQGMGVLNLSLTSKEGISEKSPYLFQTALSPRVQLESLVRFCVAEKGLKRFAILAPNNGFGRDMAKSFWDMADKFGGKISAEIFYPPNEKDFSSYVQELAGLNSASLKFRRLEQAKMADYVRDQKAKTKREPKVQLQGIRDFDAIFIPDSPKTVAQIAPTLAFFDVNDAPMLGTTEWNSEQFLKRGGRGVAGAIFPAGLHLASTNPKAQEFVKSYLEAYGVYPDLLAAQAFEAMELVAYAIRTAHSEDRNILVNQLASVKDFQTPLGTLTFDANRIAHRRLTILDQGPAGKLTEHLP